MPHVIVKLWPGNSDAQKQKLTDDIVDAVARNLGNGANSISVAFEEVPSAAWMAQVYEPEIAGKWSSLTKRPGYGPGAKHPNTH